MKSEWWQNEVIYQIYPRSFQDSNGDGVGDLRGIESRLDYLVDLGVGSIWLSPIFTSPMKDGGYDVADYRGIDPLFGTMEDFDSLLKSCHKRGIRLLLDLVPNHSSDEHPWFLESRSAKYSEKRDWYIWRDPQPDGSPPNNWLSHFGGPAWTFDQHTDQYYLHQFDRGQPDLNYRNPEVLKAMKDVIRFWLNKGVDGFRVDVIWCMMKDPEFRDEPINDDWNGKYPFERLLHIYTQDLPEVHDVIREFRGVIDEFENRVMIGEIYLPVKKLMDYYGTPEKPECHFPYNFLLVEEEDWTTTSIKRKIENYYRHLPDFGWPNWVLGNHDRPRIASKIGVERLRLAGLLKLTLSGTPTMYYGEELGMETDEIPRHKIEDPWALNHLDGEYDFGRDGVRTPMLWNDRPNAGFSVEDADTWLPISPRAKDLNVEAQKRDPNSHWNFYRRLLEIRKEYQLAHLGSPEFIQTEDTNLLLYRMGKFLVALNFGEAPATLPKDLELEQLIISTRDSSVSKTDGEDLKRTMEGYEGRMFLFA